MTMIDDDHRQKLFKKIRKSQILRKGRNRSADIIEYRVTKRDLCPTMGSRANLRNEYQNI